MATVSVPDKFHSSYINELRRANDGSKSEKGAFEPYLLDFGSIKFSLARYFGFCFGVNQAIAKVYKLLESHQNQRIFLLSEIIHNSEVNRDLYNLGVRFLTEPSGKRLFNFEELRAEDIVIVPAFGTSLEIQKEIESKGINILSYDATCPFVKKVWRRAQQIAIQGYTVIIHGKANHEETRAAFSHTCELAPTLIIQDIDEARTLASFIKGEITASRIGSVFSGRVSKEFDFERNLARVGVVNQTTMLAGETAEISRILRDALEVAYGNGELPDRFASTNDTLCYATAQNQSAAIKLAQSDADIALVVGSYNSSNTCHLYRICNQHMNSYFISSEQEIIDQNQIRSFNPDTKTFEITSDWLKITNKLGKPHIGVTAGASCPDSIIERVISKIITFSPNSFSWEKALRGCDTGT